MATDVRIAVGLGGHPKTRKLIRRLGGDGAFRLVMLWAWTAANKPDGDLSGMSDEDIELAADWQGEPDAFVRALAEVGFLDGEPGGRHLHDWADHNPFAAGATMRSKAGKKAANARWKKKGWQCDDPPSPKRGRKGVDSGTGAGDAAAKHAPSESEAGQGFDADRIEPQCGSHESALPIASKGNAPSPTPTPTPTPIPTTEARNTHHATNSARGGVCEAEEVEVAEIRPEVRAAVALRKRGVSINAMHPKLVEFMAGGGTVVELEAMAAAYPGKPGPYVVQAAISQRAERFSSANQARAGPAPAKSKTRQAIESILGAQGHDRPEVPAISHSALV